MGKKGGGGGTTKTVSEPWSGQKPYLSTAMQAAGTLFNPWTQKDDKGNITGFNMADNALAPAYYSGSTVADQSAWTKQAMQMQADAALGMASNPLITGANSAVRQIMNGNALRGNAGLNTLNSLSASAPVTQKQALQGNQAAQALLKMGNANGLQNNKAYSTLNTIAGQATGKGNAGLTALNGYAGQDFNAGNGGLQSLQGMTGQGINAGNAGLTQLNQLATNDNPYMDALYQRANDKAQASLDANFNRAGRYGSGAHEAAAADAANNLANEMYSSLYDKRINAANAASSAYNQGIGQGVSAQQAAGQLYNQGQQLGVNAAQDAASAYNQALAQRISAAQDAGSLYNQNQATRANMLSNAGNMYNQGLNTLVSSYGQQAGAAENAGSLYNTATGQRAAAAQMGQQLAQQPYTDAAMLSEAGGVQDDYNQQLINAAIEKYNYDAQRPLQALSTYNQLVSGSYGGTSNTTGQQATGSRLGNALGGAMSGAGLVGALATNPAGWMVGTGAALGGLLGLI